jgi:transposase-like protein
MLEEAEEILAFYAFRADHWREPRAPARSSASNRDRPAHRRRRHLPRRRSLIRLVSMLAIEANHDWLITRCDTSRHSMERLLEQRLHRPPDDEVPDSKRLSSHRLHRRPER